MRPVLILYLEEIAIPKNTEGTEMTEGTE